MVTAASLKKIAEGREAEMFEWEGDRVLRLYRSDYRPGMPEQQARLLRIANACGIRVPAEFGMVEVDNRPGVILERLSGPDLLTELGAKPWRLFQVGGVWGRLHAQINSKQAPQDLETTRARYTRLITQSPLVPDQFRTPALKQLEALPDGDRLSHGDFHPANIMRADGDFAAIDWSNTTRGPAEADYIRSYMLATLGDLPPGTPTLIRTMAIFGRRILRNIYNRNYCRILKPDPAVVQSWRFPVLVGRFSEGIEAEFEALTKAIRALSK
ncbi:MAG: aminoglycoside phosphotransferase family protein [Chloroflexota bacterium]